MRQPAAATHLFLLCLVGSGGVALGCGGGSDIATNELLGGFRPDGGGTTAAGGAPGAGGTAGTGAVGTGGVGTGGVGGSGGLPGSGGSAGAPGTGGGAGIGGGAGTGGLPATGGGPGAGGVAGAGASAGMGAAPASGGAAGTGGISGAGGSAGAAGMGGSGGGDPCTLPSAECTPPAVDATGCDPCSERVCGSDCTFGTCQLKATSQCEHISGTNWRCCGSSSWQFCLSSCQWSTACEVTGSAACCTGSGPRC